MPVMDHVQLHSFCSALAALPPVLCGLTKLLSPKQTQTPYLSGQCGHSCPPSGFIISVTYKSQTLGRSVILVEPHWK